MNEAVQLINEVGFPIAAAGGLGFFIWKLINRIIDGMETKLDVLDDKVAEQIAAMEDSFNRQSKKFWQWNNKARYIN